MKQVQELLHKQMTRKEFMRLFSMAFIGLFGVANYIAYLKSNVDQQVAVVESLQSKDSDKGFGTRKFGV